MGCHPFYYSILTLLSCRSWQHQAKITQNRQPKHGGRRRWHCCPSATHVLAFAGLLLLIASATIRLDLAAYSCCFPSLCREWTGKFQPQYQHTHTLTHTHFRFMPVFFSIRIQRGEGRETKLRSIRSIDRWIIETFSYRFANTSCRNTPGSIGDAPTHRTRIVLLCGANYYSPHPLLFLFTPSTTAQPPFFCCCAPTECETFLFKRKVYHCIFLSNCTTPSPSLLHQARGCDRAVR